MFSVLFLSTASFVSAQEHSHPMGGATHEMDRLKEWIGIFEDAERDEWQDPEKVIKMMGLNNGDVVADIGAGSGYFTRRFAKAVGPKGTAYGLDVEPPLVDYMKEDAKKLGLKNYMPRLAKMEDSGLEPQSIDVGFVCITYHHIANQVAYFRNFLKVLKKGGRIVVVEFYKKKISFGPPPNHKTAKEVVIKEFKEAGYKLSRSLDILRYQYFLEFKPAL